MRHPCLFHGHINPGTPPEVPITPGPGPEIEPGVPDQPEIIPPQHEPGNPGIPHGPEITPDETPQEIPDYDEGAS